jgi:hypothetical protein
MISTLLTSIVLAQDAPVSGGWDVAFTLYALGGALLVGGVGWALKRLSDYLGVRIENETVRGVLQRLVGSVGDAVAMVDQTIRKEIDAAKDPASPGGTRVTEVERKRMYDAVWERLKGEYGGFAGIFGLLKRIGIGNEESARAKVDTMIEAAVSTHKMRKRVAGNPPTPAQ